MGAAAHYEGLRISMEWMQTFVQQQPVAYAVLLLSLVAALGLCIAKVRFRGVGVGIAGVLFAGLLFGHFGCRLHPEVGAFAREFGLILFVFTIGLQLGPSFFASLKKQGWQLSLLALGVVLLGALLAALTGLLGVGATARVGLFAGATTNTPALGAAQETLGTLPEISAADRDLPALAYAVSYPMGVVGIIVTLLLVKRIFAINLEVEAEQFHREQTQDIEPLERMNLVIENANLASLTIGELPGREELDIVISRILRVGESEVHTATLATRVSVGDVVLAVGTHKQLERFRLVVGRLSEVDLLASRGQVQQRRIVVTHKLALGKSVRELGLDHLFGVTVTRVTRGDLEVSAVPDIRLQFGDMLFVVGDRRGLDQAAGLVGNSVKALNQTNFIPVFVGIALGVVLGLLPIYLPGLPTPLRMGLAGGPLIVAIVLSRINRIGPLVWYMPENANTAFRELGMILFLGCVGLKSGEHFLATALSLTGVIWLCSAALITIVPLLLMAIVARHYLKLNYLTISGLLAGSMTDPPALAFASAMSQSNAPAVAYATVYPITMLLRIVAAQLLVFMFCR